MKTEEIISAIQTKLSIQVDGRAGPETWGAIYTHIMGIPLDNSTDVVDSRSEKSIATLLLEVQPLARALVHKAALGGIQIKILSGFRSYAEQDELYALGRTKPGEKVTNARGGHSNHNFGIAFDIGVFEGNKYLTDSVKYKAVGALGMDMGLEWGGSWKTIVDQPHFQLRPAWASTLSEKAMLLELRTRISSGMPVYA